MSGVVCDAMLRFEVSNGVNKGYLDEEGPAGTSEEDTEQS